MWVSGACRARWQPARLPPELWPPLPDLVSAKACLDASRACYERSNPAGCQESVVSRGIGSRRTARSRIRTFAEALSRADSPCPPSPGPPRPLGGGNDTGPGLAAMVSPGIAAAPVLDVKGRG